MKLPLQILLCSTVASFLFADEVTIGSNKTKPEPASTPTAAAAAASEEAMAAQPKVIHLTATVDGSGRFVFTRQGVKYVHNHWRPPTNVVLDGEAWTDLSRTPSAWREIAGGLDLTKAWIVKRKGRDVVALENTPDGFDLYLVDSPNGATDYDVTIALPRRH